MEQKVSAKNLKNLQEISKAFEKPGAEKSTGTTHRPPRNTKTKKERQKTGNPGKPIPKPPRGRAKAVRRSGQAHAKGIVVKENAEKRKKRAPEQQLP